MIFNKQEGDKRQLYWSQQRQVEEILKYFYLPYYDNQFYIEATIHNNTSNEEHLLKQSERMSFENEFFSSSDSSSLQLTENSNNPNTNDTKKQSIDLQKHDDPLNCSIIGQANFDKNNRDRKIEEVQIDPRNQDMENLNASWDSLVKDNLPHKQNPHNESIQIRGGNRSFNKPQVEPKEIPFGQLNPSFDNQFSSTGGFGTFENNQIKKENVNNHSGFGFGFQNQPFGSTNANDFKKKQTQGFGFGNNDFTGGFNNKPQSQFGFGSSNNNGFGNSNSNGFGGSNGFDQQQDGFIRPDYGRGGFNSFRGRGRGGGRGRGRGRGGFNNNFHNDRFGDGGFHDNMSQGSGFNQGFNNGFNNGFSSPIYNATPMQQPPPHTQPISQPKQKQNKSNQVGQIQIIPKARICWPSVNIYVLGTQIRFTYRPLHQHQHIDIMVIPFRNTKFDLYGGNIINSCSYNYRNRISQKINLGEVYDGSAYIKNCMGNDRFKYFAFIKIAEEQNDQHFIKGLQSLFLILSTVGKQIPRSKIIIPISKELGDPQLIFKTIIDNIEKVELLKRIILTTTSSQCFTNNLVAYTKVYQQLIEDCRISIQ